MKRPWTWAASAGLVAVVAAGFIPLSLWSAPLQRELEEQIVRTTALQASATGRVTLAALPIPRVIYEKVRIGDPDGSISVASDRLVADLSLSRLLTGEIEFTELHFERPRVSIDASESRPENVPAIRRAINAPSASDEARRADRARLGRIKIINGSVRMRAHEELVVLVDRVNATIDWPNLGSKATLTGHGMWRDERFDLDLLLGKPAEVLRGEKSPFIAKLASRLIDISADGALSGGARWMFDARVASSSDRFNQFLALIDAQPPVPGRLSRVALSGHLRALPQSARLSEVKLTIDANTFDGSLTLLTGEKRPKISGTLATRSYDLGAGDAGLPVMRRERRWNRDAIAIGQFDLFDADLRLSAARLNLGRLTLADAGFVLALDDGLLEITTAGADAYGGSLRGRWQFNARTATPELSATGSFKNINITSFLRGMGHPNVAGGAASGEFTVQTRGSNVDAMMQNVSGVMRSSIRTPEIVGVDLERALRRTERRPLSIPSELRSGQTSFAAAEIEAKIEQGAMILERAVAAGPGVEVAVAGELSLANRTLQLEVMARQPAPAKPPADGREPPSLVLGVEGPWDYPALSIDPDSLIKRSEAAAPLWRRPQSPQPAITPVER